MVAGFASTDREEFAHTILKCSQKGDQSELIALAWTLRNRAGTANGTAACEAVELSRALLADIGINAGSAPRANGNGRAGSCLDATAFQQALACVSLVFDGLLPDPTNGASRVHLHDQAPDWASDFEPTALIGPLMFLREDPNAEMPRDSSARS